MRRILVAGALAIATLAILAPPTYAQQCNANGFPQADMVGVYVNPESPMRVEIYPCGGALVRWDNAYGSHAAVYGSTNRLPGGGVAATVLPSSGIPLDGSSRIGFKPAEPGYIQVVTLGVYDDTYRVYRLKRIG